MIYQVDPKRLKKSLLPRMMEELNIESVSNEDLSIILNLAIESGLLSPPVWMIRNNTTGELARHPLCDSLNLLVDKTVSTVEGWQYEHFKGQTE